jgi:phosphohistidine phosphatase SixA
LTAHGRRAAIALGETLRAEHWTPTAAFTSPLRRARETAALVLEHAGIGVECLVLDALAPDRDAEDAATAALDHGGASGHLLLVGHQPLLSRLALLLTHEEPAPAPGDFARIEFPDGEGLGRGVLTRVIRANRG